jgi:hypothetical protein
MAEERANRYLAVGSPGVSTLDDLSRWPHRASTRPTTTTTRPPTRAATCLPPNSSGPSPPIPIWSASPPTSAITKPTAARAQPITLRVRASTSPPSRWSWSHSGSFWQLAVRQVLSSPAGQAPDVLLYRSSRASCAALPSSLLEHQPHCALAPLVRVRPRCGHGLILSISATHVPSRFIVTARPCVRVVVATARRTLRRPVRRHFEQFVAYVRGPVDSLR